jgi:pyruvate dehydrogenase E2 component (dihydrolipoamide acetyltransferase)
MATEVIMPALGMAQETGKVIRWLKVEGDLLVKGEPLVEIETDKVTVEIESPADGTLAEIWVAADEEVPVGTAIAVVLAEGESLTEVLTRRDSDVDPPPVAADARTTTDVGALAVTIQPESKRRGRKPASPKARRIAESRGVDIETLTGSGPNGTVTAADVEAAPGADIVVTGDAVEDAQPSSGGYPPVGSIWRVMAERTTRSWQEVPQFVLERDTDVTRTERWLAAAREHHPERPSLTDLLVKICAEALRRHPAVNASWQGDSIALHDDINVGLAVATEQGLVVPVVHAAQSLSLVEISLRRREIVARAREGRLRPPDVADGTFTISNLGMYGVDRFQAIVNAPQAAILAVGRISERAVVSNGDLLARPILTLSVTFDHRVVDGARGAEFLQTVADLIEEPIGLVH